MALTPSTMLPLGTLAPDFQLPEALTGKFVSLSDFPSTDLLLVIFLSNHCPYVKHLRQALAIFVQERQSRGLSAVGINANDVLRYPDDSPERMVGEVKLAGYTFPYLFDESQAIAKAYRAACTPDFFLFGRDRRLIYRGQFDGSRPGNGVPLSGADLKAAVEAALRDEPIPSLQKPSMGCNIKWKQDNEPEYF